MKQVLSIEQMKHLQELGLELKETLLYWAIIVDEKKRESTNYTKWILVKGKELQTVEIQHWEFCPAYTLQDIIENLPCLINIYTLTIQKTNKGWSVLYMEPYCRSVFKIENSEEFIDATYNMMCWCIKNEYIKTKELK